MYMATISYKDFLASLAPGTRIISGKWEKIEEWRSEELDDLNNSMIIFRDRQSGAFYRLDFWRDEEDLHEYSKDSPLNSGDDDYVEPESLNATRVYPRQKVSWEWEGAK